ncbi:hypothetical protein [Arthrobacter woluwensis]|uniref:hypothetical protein n=1 Tax=Arthrobacter woluwensis TaxID=156980 RepID=UPI001AAF06C1|nr:hypothetical protein [Arthrobacter woluwensis]QTF71755.1 hypothetical protein G8758_06880 [Arthrobacter woluwensis]
MIVDRIETTTGTSITNASALTLNMGMSSPGWGRHEYPVDGDAQTRTEGGRLQSHVAAVMDMAARAASGDRASQAALDTYLDMCEGCTEYLEDCICDRMCNECHDLVSECACADEVPC